MKKHVLAVHEQRKEQQLGDTAPGIWSHALLNLVQSDSMSAAAAAAAAGHAKQCNRNPRCIRGNRHPGHCKLSDGTSSTHAAQVARAAAVAAAAAAAAASAKGASSAGGGLEDEDDSGSESDGPVHVPSRSVLKGGLI
jgi:hypothetical protein